MIIPVYLLIIRLRPYDSLAAPVRIGRRQLFDVILPPFERLVAAGVRSVMNSYAEIDGEAPAASQ